MEEERLGPEEGVGANDDDADTEITWTDRAELLESPCQKQNNPKKKKNVPAWRPQSRNRQPTSLPTAKREVTYPCSWYYYIIIPYHPYSYLS